LIAVRAFTREARQPEFTNPDRCENSGQRPPDGVPLARNTEFFEAGKN